MNEADDATAAAARARLPRSIWALGFVSLFMDISSEMIHSLLPVFLVTVLGASAVTVGLIEGIGEATASMVWYHFAATGGDLEADQFRDALSRRMDSSALTEAKRLAADIAPRVAPAPRQDPPR